MRIYLAAVLLLLVLAQLSECKRRHKHPKKHGVKEHNRHEQKNHEHKHGKEPKKGRHKGNKRVCKVWGDPHYLTYDNYLVHYQGTCSYLLTGTCSSSTQPHFQVFAKNMYRGNNRKVSFIKLLQVNIGSYKIQLRRGKIVLVNGHRKIPPIKNIPGLKVFMSGKYVVVTLNSGIHIRYDGGMVVLVTMTNTKYRKSMCGICGNFDGLKKNDMRIKAGTKAWGKKGGAQIGNSWRIHPDIEGEKTCDYGDEDLPKCEGQPAQLAKTKFCAPITAANSVFAECSKKLGAEETKTIFASCVTDVCFADKDKQQDVTCQALSTLADKCAENGIEVKWRSLTGCGIDCGANEVFGKALSGCPSTCSDPDAEEQCNLDDMEGCECKVGYLLSNTQCVPESDCGCKDPNDNYHRKGDTWLSKDCATQYMCVSFKNIQTKQLKGCHANAQCILVEGHHKCMCKDSFAGDGINTCNPAATTKPTEPPTMPTTKPTEPPTMPTNPLEPECVGKKIDLAFVFDESSSINADDFEKIKGFAKGIVEKLPVGKDATQVGMMTFSSSAKEHFELRRYSTQNRVTNAIQIVFQNGGITNTHLALEELVNLMSSSKGARPDAMRIAILETDGASEKPELTRIAAAAARSAGITLICVGIGRYDKKELNDIATDPDSEHVFEVANADGLLNIVTTIAKAACSGTPPPSLAPTLDSTK